MNTRLFLIASVLVLSTNLLKAQPPLSGMGELDREITSGLDMSRMETSFVLSVNSMNDDTKEKLNRVASNYRSRNKSVLAGLGASMLAGGFAAVVNIAGTEIINLTQIRSKQKKAWQEMRKKECTFVDSLQ